MAMARTITRTMNHEDYRRALDALEQVADGLVLAQRSGTIDWTDANDAHNAVVRVRSAVERGYYFPSELGTEAAPWSRVLGALALADRLGIGRERHEAACRYCGSTWTLDHEPDEYDECPECGGW